MRTLLALFAAVGLTSAAEPGTWRCTLTESGSLPSDTGRWWKITATRDGAQSVPVMIVAPDLAHGRLELVMGSGDAPHADRDALARSDTLAMLNAGYFDHDRRAVGWRCLDGIVQGDIDDGTACTGFAWVEESGSFHLSLRSAGAPAAARWGIQAGPFLVDPGGTHGINRGDGPAARRSVIAATGDGQPLLIAVDHALTLAATADLVLALPAAIGVKPVDAALNLDGGPSTALAVPAAGLAVTARGPVIDVWRVVAAPPESSERK